MSVEVIGTEVKSIDLAALLLAYGFELDGVSTIEAVSLDSVTRQEDKGTMTSWRFKSNAPNGTSLNTVRSKWELPRRQTVDPVPVARLLAHNHAALRHLARTPQPFHVRDLGGLGMVDRNGGTRYEFGTVYGGTADTDTMALAITLGVRLLGVGVQMGQMRAEFASDPGALTLADVRALLKSEELRREDNLTMCALMVCMLDNRKTILDNMHNFRKQVRLTADGGQTQALYTPSTATREQKEQLERHFS